MAHTHDHHHHHQSSKNIAVAFFLNLGFAIFEFFGGIYTNSMAITSDALHDFGDSVSLGVSWYFERIARRKPSQRFSYGLKRFSLIGAIINSLVLLSGSILILWEVIPRLFAPEASDAKGMLIFAIVGIAVNGFAVLRLRGGHSLNERVVSLHLLEDVLGWVAVLVGSVLMMWFDWPIIDPVLSILITLFILYNVVKNLRSITIVILQGVPEGVDSVDVGQALLSMPGVQSIHDLHVWSMDSDYNVLSVHVVSDGGCDAAAIKNSIREMLDHKFHIQHATIEVEKNDEHCSMECCN